ncbi:MAG: DNA ligase D [Ginsengibacter sp.]
MATIKKLQIEEKKAAFPESIQPMLATLIKKPFDSDEWIYEVKWDGYRALAFLNKGQVSIKSRNEKSFDEKFYAIHEELKKWKINAVVDGEIIVANKQGMADFGQLQNWRSEADGNLVFYVFDILWLDGKSLMDLPLTERRAILKSHIPKSDSIILSQNFETSGIDFFKTAEEMKMEGIMAKRKDSIYVPGSRSKDWLKIKTDSRQEVVIGGYTVNDGSSKLFSSLMVGVYEKNNLIYTGKVGTGFTEKMQAEMMKLFKDYIVAKCPFDQVPDINKPSRFRPDPPHANAVWLNPELICEVSFRELTSDGIMRHPSFKGMRADKKASEVVLEVPEDSEPTKEKINKISIVGGKSTERKSLLNPTDEKQVRKVNGHEIAFNNLGKVYWPQEGITKREMLNYYYQVAPYILPYLKNRPQSLNRFPNGIDGKSFYQKNMTGKVPDWIDTFPYTSEGIQKNFMLCNNEATLLYMASLGCIEFNPWSSTIDKPDNPDWCIIDLDPDKNTFDQVIETALITKQILDAAGVACYCKTSGSTGIHIYIPLGKKYTYEDSKEFGRVIAHMVNNELPDFTSIERLISNRDKKLYIDFLQNRPNATVATAYSLRPKPGATVSMPLHWEEVKKGLKMSDFTIKNALDRIREQGDFFKSVMGKGIDMKKALDELSKI